MLKRLQIVLKYMTCADPDSYVRGGPTLTSFFSSRGEWGTKKRLLVGHHWPASETPFVMFPGILISITKKPYMLVNFRGGGGGPDPLFPPPFESAHGLQMVQKYMTIL